MSGLNTVKSTPFPMVQRKDDWWCCTLSIIIAYHSQWRAMPPASHVVKETPSGDILVSWQANNMCARVRACGDSRPLLAALHYPNLSYAAPSYIALSCPVLCCAVLCCPVMYTCIYVMYLI